MPTGVYKRPKWHREIMRKAMLKKHKEDLRMKKLVIAPHIDDEVVGCGGILDEDTIVYFCGVDQYHIIPKEERLKELQKVCDFYNYKYNVNEKSVVNKYCATDFIDDFQDTINVFKPEKVYIPYPSYNQDHQQIYNAAMIALRPHDKNFFVKKVLVYEGIGAFQWYKPDYEVNHFVEIDIERKLEGYARHKSQIRGHRSFEHVRALATLRGSQIGVKYAEAYIIKRWVE
jgi:LmbE family N-acetylglucosaminyl deacetylase